MACTVKAMLRIGSRFQTTIERKVLDSMLMNISRMVTITRYSAMERGSIHSRIGLKPGTRTWFLRRIQRPTAWPIKV
ncbi:hypothetical protein D3C75_1268370 [compost metagenome]